MNTRMKLLIGVISLLGLFLFIGNIHGVARVGQSANSNTMQDETTLLLTDLSFLADIYGNSNPETIKYKSSLTYTYGGGFGTNAGIFGAGLTSGDGIVFAESQSDPYAFSLNLTLENGNPVTINLTNAQYSSGIVTMPTASELHFTWNIQQAGVNLILHRYATLISDSQIIAQHYIQETLSIENLGAPVTINQISEYLHMDDQTQKRDYDSDGDFETLLAINGYTSQGYPVMGKVYKQSTSSHLINMSLNGDYATVSNTKNILVNTGYIKQISLADFVTSTAKNSTLAEQQVMSDAVFLLGQFLGSKPVVVLVHGWHGTIFHSTDTCLPIAGHAIDINNISDNDFGVFARNLIIDGWDVWIAHVATGPNGTPLIEDNALCLKNQLANIRNQTNVSKVVLIAHSMGGLVSRAYMENKKDGFYADDVAQLITLGTPHVGTTAGLAPCLNNGDDYAACQFSPLGIGFFNQTYSQRARNVIYNFIGGNLTPFVLGKQLKVTDGPNDGVVGVNSGIGYSYKPRLFKTPLIETVITGEDITRYALPASHTTGILGWHPSFFNVTTGNVTDLTDAYQCVRKLLDIQGGSCPFTQTAEIMTTELITTTVSQLPTFSDHLAIGQVTTYTLPIDTSGQSQFTLTWITGTLNLTLTDPFGTVIDPAYSASHPAEVAYYENVDPSSQLLAGYTFTSTVSGDYTISVTAGTLGASGTDYTVSTLVDSPRAFNFAMDKTLYSIGDTAVISASVQNAGIGLTGAIVEARVYRSGVFTDIVTLIDQGGGVYTGTYTIPNFPGYLGLSLIVEGVDNGAAYARQIDSLLAVSPPTVQLNDQYSDTPQDTDNNGLYESLNLGIGITSTQAGYYLVSADLVGPSSEFVAHGVISVILGTGVLTTTLPFNGDDIRYSGVDGPYTLTNLTIIDQQFAGVPAVWIVPNVWTTIAYNHTSFGTCKTLSLLVNPSISGNVITSPVPNCNSGAQFVTGTVITLTANAGSGYEFYNWSGGLISNTNPVSITISSDLVITANFTVSLATITPTPTPSETPTPTRTSTPSPTITPSPSNTPTSTASQSPTPTGTPTPSPTFSPTPTATPSSSSTPTSTTTATSSPLPTVTPTDTEQPPTATPSPTPVITPTPFMVEYKVYLPIVLR